MQAAIESERTQLVSNRAQLPEILLYAQMRHDFLPGQKSGDYEEVKGWIKEKETSLDSSKYDAHLALLE